MAIHLPITLPNNFIMIILLHKFDVIMHSYNFVLKLEINYRPQNRLTLAYCIVD